MQRKHQAGFVMGVVLFALVALSLAGATAVLLSSSEIDMVAAYRQQKQLQACAQAGVSAEASNLPTPINAPAAWAVDSQRPTAEQLFKAKPEHIDATSIIGGTLGSPLNALSPDAASAILSAAQTGSSLANAPPSGLNSATFQAPAASSQIQVFRLISTCSQTTTAAKLESEGVYVYNPN